MSKSSLHNCQTCEHAIADAASDCASCKLATLMKAKSDAEQKKKFTIDEDGDYSISEKLTEKGSDHSILYLVLAALFTFGLVVLFSAIFRG